MKYAALLQLLLSALQYRAARAVQCYVGINEATKVDVEKPYCSFSIKYHDHHCNAPPHVVLTKHDSPNIDLILFETESLCYDSENSITCLCFGHLCNDEFNQKEILAMELLKQPSPSMKHLIVCYLLNNHAHAVFSVQKKIETTTEAEEPVLITSVMEPRDQDDHRAENAAKKKEKIAQRVVKKKKGTHSTFPWLLVIASAAAVILVVVIAAVLVVAILVLKKRKKSKNDKEKPISDEKEKSTSDEKPHISWRDTEEMQGVPARLSPSADYNQLSYGPIGFGNDITFERHGWLDRNAAPWEEQEKSAMRSDSEYNGRMLDRRSRSRDEGDEVQSYGQDDFNLD